MSQSEKYEVLVLGSGEGGKYLAWHTAQSGRRTAVVERRWVGGSCPNINCLPSNNEIWSAKVADLLRHAAKFGTVTSTTAVDMARVRLSPTRRWPRDSTPCSPPSRQGVDHESERRC